jgi:hypothetical protein
LRRPFAAILPLARRTAAGPDCDLLAPDVTDLTATNQQPLAKTRDPNLEPLTTRLRPHEIAGSEEETEKSTMSALTLKFAEPVGVLEPSNISCRNTAALALTVVRDGVITGEGPTTRGRVHFSRALDADDAAWCARILTASAVDHEPVSRAEAEALFEINDAAAERSDDGRFDDLLAKAVVHHAASASGLPVPPRTVALSPQTAIESWAPTRAVGVDTEVLEWLASQMRGKRRSNRTLMSLVATIVGAATLPLAQLPNVFDIGI